MEKSTSLKTGISRGLVTCTHKGLPDNTDTLLQCVDIHVDVHVHVSQQSDGQTVG